MKYLLLLLLLLSPISAHALTQEEGSDAPTRGIEDYIKDFVDIPESATDWKTFGKTKAISIETKDSDGLDVQYYKPDFAPEIKALDGKMVKVKGFMFPLNETEDQKQFLLGPFPLNCPFQYHVQSNLVIEVNADENPVEFTYDPVTMEGTLELVPEDKENGTFYRLKNARALK